MTRARLRIVIAAIVAALAGIAAFWATHNLTGNAPTEQRGAVESDRDPGLTP